MPDIQFNCPECANSLAIDTDGAGLSLQCPSCSKDITVPKLESKATPSPEPINKQMKTSETNDPVLDKFLNGQPNQKSIKKTYNQVKQILTQGENILYIATQKKPLVVPNFSPDSVVLTSKRFIVFQPSLFGLKKNFTDYIWRDLKDAHMKEGIMGATVTMIPVSGNRLVVDYLPKKQARKLYSLSQEMEQKVREERRIRGLEDKRAAAGGVVLQGLASQAPSSPPQTQPIKASDNPVDTLKQLKDMLDAALISEDEYNTKKAEILSKM